MPIQSWAGVGFLALLATAAMAEESPREISEKMVRVLRHDSPQPLKGDVAKLTAFFKAYDPNREKPLTQAELLQACALINATASPELAASYLAQLSVDSDARPFKGPGFDQTKRDLFAGLLVQNARKAAKANDAATASTLARASMLLSTCDYPLSANLAGALTDERSLTRRPMQFDPDAKRNGELIDLGRAMTKAATPDFKAGLPALKAFNAFIDETNAGAAKAGDFDRVLKLLDERWKLLSASKTEMDWWTSANQTWRVRSALKLNGQNDHVKALDATVQQWRAKETDPLKCRWLDQITTAPSVAQKDVGIQIVEDPNAPVLKGDAPN